MHQSAMFYGRRFFEVYCPTSPAPAFTVVEIGSQNVNGSLREVCPAGVKYIGLDFVPGNGVDIVIEDPYKLPLPDGVADVIVCSSCLEHSQFFWLVVLEAMRVLKPEGVFYVNAPSNGFFHQWPVDCWRFYPDSGHAMVAWANRNGHDALLLESFIGQRSAGRVSEGGMWSDFVAVMLKDRRYRGKYPIRIVHSLTDFSNGYSSEVEGILNHSERGPDFSLIEAQRELLDAHERDTTVADLRSTLSDRDRTIGERDTTVADLRSTLSDRDRTIGERDSRIERLLRDLDAGEERIAERDARIATDKASLSALERAISQLRQELAAAGQETDAVRQQLGGANQALDKMRRSSSWRMTAPYRAVRDLTKRPIRSFGHSDVLYRAVTSPLLLPAYLAYNGNRHGFYRSWRRGSGFVPMMVTVQGDIRDRLRERGPIYRRIASLGFSWAVRIHECGGVFPAMGTYLRILRRERVGGVRRWLRASAPGMARLAEASPVEGTPALAPQVARRVLVADYRIPRADFSAGERATVGILRDLRALGFEVVFLPTDMAPSPRYEDELGSLGVEVITSASGHTSAAQYLNQCGARFGSFYFIRVDVAEALLPAARQAAPHARVIFHAPDVYFLRELRAAEWLKDETARQRAMITRARELSIMRRSDHVVVVSPAEVSLLEPDLPDTPISVFPVLYAPVTPSPAGYAERRDIFFLGGFAHLPNVHAVQWFATDVWPIVRASLPDVEFHIVGAEAPESVLALARLPGIKVVGFVPDLDPVLRTLRVGVAPLLYGAGIKGKVAMTLGAGIPCVCTTVAVEGMGIENDVHSLVADEPGEFAAAVVSLYSNARQWERLSHKGQALVRERYGDAANRAALLEVLDDAHALPLDLYCDHFNRVRTEMIPSSREEEAVDVSIIVPVYNKWHLTRACLASVVQTSGGSGASYEVILGDDCSTDESVHAADSFPGLRVVRTPSNLGFLRNCKNAVQHARGRYILLLNNDTIVLPGWLKALYRTIESDPTIAIVGSKLLYPDGHIQEAGGGLLADGDGVSIGREVKVGDRTIPVDRNAPVFNIERETDYISGASILVRKSFWDAVGGFDERYQTAYCEDSDLAMTARAHGMRVVYQPASEVVHLEHQSYAEQEDADHTQLQVQNKRLLVQKWGETMRRDHVPPGSGWHLVAANGDRTASVQARMRRRAGKLNVLYFSPFPSHPSIHGNQATIQQFASRFQALGHKVHFALLQSNMYQPQDVEAMRDAWDTLDIVPNGHPLTANGASIPFDGWYEEGLGERIWLLCARYDIDVVFCSYVFQSKLLEFVPSHILKVIDTHDKMGDRYEMLRRNGQPLEFFSCTPQEEGAYLRRADVVVARRDEEARYFNSVTGLDTAIVIPHIEDAHFVEKSFEVLRNVGMVASANRINLALIRECIEAIGHRLRGSDCPFVVNIAGQVKNMIDSLTPAEAAVFHKPWVRLHGFVPDIGAFYANMDVVVSPVTMGTGINVKTVQAMAYGMPLLTTAWGSKGIETDEPMHLHGNLDELVSSLFGLAENARELDRLANVSRRRYQEFLEKSVASMQQLFSHPKLCEEFALSPSKSAAIDKQEISFYEHTVAEGNETTRRHLSEEAAGGVIRR